MSRIANFRPDSRFLVNILAIHSAGFVSSVSDIVQDMTESTKKFITKNEKQTGDIGLELGRKLKAGGIIALYGNLGAGKTVFIKGVAKGLDIKSRITSPTFVFWRVYPIAKKLLKHFCHVDLYRLPDRSSLQNIGIEEYWERNDTVCLIEWAEKVKQLPKNKIIHSVKIKILDQKTREIEIISL